MNASGLSTSDTLATYMPRIERIPIGVLRINPRNARTHSRRQVGQIAASIKKFGFLNPVLIDDANMVLAGHGRLEAAKLEGLDSVPVVRFGHLGPGFFTQKVPADAEVLRRAGNLVRRDLGLPPVL